jgi:tetrahydromethanopterin S-methyltransferase subunit C
MLTTLGFIALLIGAVLVIVGYTVEPRTLRPGWGCIILAVVLIVIGYLLPTLATHDHYDNALAAVTHQD